MVLSTAKFTFSVARAVKTTRIARSAEIQAYIGGDERVLVRDGAVVAVIQAVDK